jgi:hypothetical protein
MYIDLLQKFQTGIVGLLGFTGVILTLFTNAWIARRQARDTRNHERETLARALLAELSSHRRSIARNVEEVTKRAEEGTGSLLAPAITNTLLFDASVARFGLVSSLTRYLRPSTRSRRLTAASPWSPSLTGAANTGSSLPRTHRCYGPCWRACCRV